MHPRSLQPIAAVPKRRTKSKAGGSKSKAKGKAAKATTATKKKKATSTKRSALSEVNANSGAGAGAGAGAGSSRQAKVDATYDKVTQKEHILLRPDTYGMLTVLLSVCVGFSPSLAMHV